MRVELLFNLGSGPVLVQAAVVHAAGIEELKLPGIKHFNLVTGKRHSSPHKYFNFKRITETRSIVIS
jgi:hypothetical protein